MRQTRSTSPSTRAAEDTLNLAANGQLDSDCLDLMPMVGAVGAGRSIGAAA